MLHKRLLFLLMLLCTCAAAYAQQAVLSGVVRDDNTGKPLEQVLVADSVSGHGAYTNAKGYYMFEAPADRNLALIYLLTGYETKRTKTILKSGETRTIDLTLEKKSNELKEFVLRNTAARSEAGMVGLDISKVPYMPSTVGGVEALIKLAVGSHDELTSQYSVRGGSFDENLVYVDDFEVYRPFLVRTGQQEGLSFVNSDLVSNVNFSVGGFQAKYGDKMSSVLDVTYKRPTTFAGSVSLSLLGASMHLEGASRHQKLTYLIGARQKSNQYLLQSQPTKGVYNPSFTDIQALINYRVNSKWELEAIGNYARNRFSFYPQSQTTSFGELNMAYQLDVFYTGSELDQFDSRFAGLSATYHPESSPLRLKFLVSGFQTNESETYDISGQYLFGELQTDQTQNNFGQIKTYLGTGTIQDFARNYLTVNVGDAAVRGSYDLKNNFIQFGANATITAINDDLHQWERRDSAGFTQPYNPAALTMAYFYNTSANFNYTRISGFVQDNIRFDSANKYSATIGVRYNYSFLNGESIVSPRGQFAYNPHWKRDVIFALSTGIYAQPPFYREMRDMQGNLNLALKAQKSYHAVVSADYNFKVNGRPYKIKAEGYYKYLWDIDPYVYNNVQITYTGKNDAVGYVYGGEVRLYGDIVKDATSFISIGLMKASQKITDSSSIPGYNSFFPLPSDQRFSLGMYFEDYLPHNKNYKVHLNAIYSSGLPVGSPYGHLYQDILRLPAYKRVDIGFSALLLDGSRTERPAHSFFNNIKSIWGSVEVFNLLGIQNTLSYSWIQDDSSQKTFAVPNYLTARLLNVKLLFNF